MKKTYFKPQMRYTELMDTMPLCFSNTEGDDNTTGGPFNNNPGIGGNEDTTEDGFASVKSHGLFDDEW